MSRKSHFKGHEFAFDGDSGFEKVSISHLNQVSQFVIVHGVVIGKSSMRSVPTKKGFCCVLNFTIRDSPIDTINVSCWGTDEQLQAFNSFAIGDVVEIKNPQIKEKSHLTGQEKFNPPTTSCYTLLLSIRNSQLAVCDGDAVAELVTLIHCPMYTSKNYVSLAEIVWNNQTADGIYANLLVSLKHVGTLDVVTTKNGDQKNKLELVVFDQNCSAFSVVIWDKETAMFVLNRLALRNVLLISDVRLMFNKFKKQMTATAGSSTIFTPNPDIPNAVALYQFAQTATFEEGLAGTQSGHNLYTIHDVLQLVYQSQVSPFVDTEGVLFAFLSHFDVDGITKVTSIKCPECKQFIKGKGRCTNKNCAVGVGFNVKQPEDMFHFFVSVSDHTGTLKKCYVSDKVMQDLLKLTATEYKNLPDVKKTELKWQHLLEKYKINFKILQGSVVFGKPMICIMACARADPEELASHYEHLF